MKVVYTDKMIEDAKKLFPDWTELHKSMELGQSSATDLLYPKIGFYVDEDDIIKAFRNKKENKILDLAKRSRSIRSLYQQMVCLVDSTEIEIATRNNYLDCF